jgi:hypothetical protein
VGHGVAGVGDQVERQSLALSGIRDDGTGFVHVEQQTHLFPDQSLHQRSKRVQQLREIKRPRSHGLRRAKLDSCFTNAVPRSCADISSTA